MTLRRTELLGDGRQARGSCLGWRMAPWPSILATQGPLQWGGWQCPRLASRGADSLGADGAISALSLLFP